ncbi:FAD:protein FMN transferase [Massilia aerilata]|uniref:FAD:protein FMN transferase n=1 Tax=Massilia aerilata TaxID=453817 RepID=A0ABW0RSX8_9BURK
MHRRSFIAAALGSIAGAGAAGEPPLRLHTAAGLAFGTTVSVSVRHADEALAQRALAAALAEARRIDGLMSLYDPASQVYRLNRDKTLDDPDPHLLAVLAHARALSRLTLGAFDITVQPLWRTFRAAAGLPPERERLLARSLVDWTRVQSGPRRVALGHAGMAITLNGLAQGYAADLALAALRRHGIGHALVDTGEYASLGRAGARPWTLGVRDPLSEEGLAARVALDGRCVATSGDYAAAFTADRLHHHIFDPATGDSPLELASVTVLAPTGLEADGLSTAFMVMGARRAHTLAARLPGVDLLTVGKRGEAWQSAGFPAV